MPKKIDSVERLLNLVIALLGSRRGRSRKFIRDRVNGYAPAAGGSAGGAKQQVAFERMFERDKDTLRQVGIPIRTATSFDGDDEEQTLYRIDPADYRVPEIRLDEPAMTMLAVAANLWTGAAFSGAAQSALRKVATRAGLGWYDDDTTVQARVRTLEPAFEPLWTALRESRPATFDYRAAGAAETTTRTVQPWGLGSKYGQWYLFGYDEGRAGARNFRLSRIQSEVAVDAGRTFERPAGFSIAEVLKGLGTGEPATARIEVPVGGTHSLRNRNGTTVSGPGTRPGTEILSVPYREPELMADDLASLGPVAVVQDPPSLRQAVLGRLQAAAAAAETPPGPEGTAALPPVLGARIRQLPGGKADSRERLLRLLSMAPFLVANPGIPESELAAEFNLGTDQLKRDLDTLSVTGLPGYLHGDLMDVFTEQGHVYIRDAETLSAPLRLTQEEACALLVGLDALTALAGSAEAASLATAIEAVREVAGPDAWLAGAVALALVGGSELETIAALQAMIQERTAARITYLVRSRDELTERTIEPHRLFSIDSAWYVRAWCRNAGELRNFRVDHIQSLAAAGPQEHDLPGHEALDPAAVPQSAYMPRESDALVSLLADPATARRLAPAYDGLLHEPGNGREDLLGLQILVADSATIPPLMARLGGHARVLAPEAVCRQVGSWLAAALAAYEPDHAVGENAPGTSSKYR
ncbi:YafY family protein [Arthrobacter sp. STN4]|uniref:helix-turn-helix transcriptional regulator n=1 Tax=Arthrobacter sp. STN4 TaxID=2923276 RepID=UPI00211A47FF|nr:WYL domain-containing protein [Arthrobacter sp. STN4]MCQ9165796.1 WYL domain-containing protein [Arthrobacter sp. STN4]